MTQLRILHAIETPGTGGAERVLVDVARSLTPPFTSHGLGLVDGWTVAQLRAHGIDTEVLPLMRAFDFSWPRRFAKFLRLARIDVVHCHEFTTSCYAALGCMLASVPLIATVHGKNYWPERAYRRTALRWAMGRSSAFVAVSDDLRRHMVEKLGVRAERITVVSNGIDLAKFRPDAASSAAVRARHGARADDVVLICVGALEPVKAHDVLFEAFAAVRAQAPNVRLWLVGEGYLRESLEQRSAALGLADAVRFLGWQTDVHALIAAADLSVLASRSEGMPLAVIESMACGRAVVATRVGGTAEIIEDGRSGLLVPPDSAARLSSALLGLVRDAELRERLARAGLTRARERFSLQRMVTRYEELYRAAAGVT
jgi:glycosyltransferase involved in cell wall biosynthesis